MTAGAEEVQTPSFLPASRQRKSRKPFHDFLLGGAAGGRLVFSFESSGQGDPKGDSLINGNLSMDIHSYHIRLIISLNHTQKFPTISFIKTCMVCNQIDRSNSFRFHIFHNNIQQLSRNSLTTIFLFRVYCTYIWRKVFPVMKIIFDYSKTTYNPFFI